MIVQNIFVGLAALALIVNLWVTIELALGIGKMKNLNMFLPETLDDPPKVSVIVPACNEEKTIKEGLLSLLAQNYPNLEIIVVNDRSTDQTQKVLLQLREEGADFILHTIASLPSGWLGKNHAMYVGASAAQGDILLFTDADVIMEKTTLSRAVYAMLTDQLDHLALMFKNIARGQLLNAMIMEVGGGLLYVFKPWKVSDPKSNNFVGVGAFNMIRKEVYENIGGYEQVKMHPIDDIMLGRLVKENGYQQDCFIGSDFVTVPWYDSPRAMVQGLMKNIFSLYDFRLSYAFVSIVAVILTGIVPLVGIFSSNILARNFCLLALAIRFLSFAYGARATGGGIYSFPFALLTPFLSIFMTGRAAVMTIWNNGIEWRGTHYSLEELRQNTWILSALKRRREG